MSSITDKQIEELFIEMLNALIEVDQVFGELTKGESLESVVNALQKAELYGLIRSDSDYDA